MSHTFWRLFKLSCFNTGSLLTSFELNISEWAETGEWEWIGKDVTALHLELPSCIMGARGNVAVEALDYKLEGRGFDTS
jgi:hypothetical protein